MMTQSSGNWHRHTADIFLQFYIITEGGRACGYNIELSDMKNLLHHFPNMLCLLYSVYKKDL